RVLAGRPPSGPEHGRTRRVSGLLHAGNQQRLNDQRNAFGERDHRSGLVSQLARPVHRQGGRLNAESTPIPALSTTRRGRALVVDDEPSLVRAGAGDLRHEGYTVDTAAGGESALAVARHQPPDGVRLALRL